MTVVVKCQSCKSVLLVIDEKTIDKPMYTTIGKMAVAGREIKLYKPGDTSYKADKFAGEVDCDVCGSETNATPLFGNEEEQEGEVEVGRDGKPARRKGKK